MKPAAAKVSGNQGRMVGRRLAVGFRQIVPGVFPTGVVTDRQQPIADYAPAQVEKVGKPRIFISIVTNANSPAITAMAPLLSLPTTVV
ncbi:MAG: hypothetical protein PHT80_11645 [Lentisphaeria bacterium]|nr:hypothetical protein [Lentisphaeria bacterium]